jgi:putative transposase
MESSTLVSNDARSEVAERWVGSCRRDLLDHIIAVDERHLKRLLSEYVRYPRGQHSFWTRERDHHTAELAPESHVRLGGLHHRYDRAA